jgi:hypothetical protein
VVVVIQTRLGQHVGLMVGQHAQRHAGFKAHAAHALHHLDDGGHVAVLGLRQAAPMQNRLDPLSLARAAA